MRYIYFILFSFLFYFPLLASNLSSITLKEQIDNTKGLAHNGVTSMLEDSRGYLWISTYDGLNSYNGFDVRTYKNTIDKKLFQSNRIRSLVEDKRGRLWIGTDEGVTVFNYQQDSFVMLKDSTQQHPVVRHLFYQEDQEKMIALTESDGIWIYNEELVCEHQTNYPYKTHAYAGLLLDQHHFLIANERGLLLYNLQKDKFTTVAQEEIPSALALTRISDHTYYVSLKFGFKKLEVEMNKAGELAFSISKETYHKEIQQKVIQQDPQGGLWIGSAFNGFRYLPKGKAPGAKTHIWQQTNRISGFLFDSKQNIWVSTFDSGIYRYKQENQVFGSYNEMQLKNPQILPYDSTRFLVKSPPMGLSLYHTESQTMSPAPFHLPSHVTKLSKHLTADTKGGYWIWVASQQQKQVYKVSKQGTKVIESPLLMALKRELPSISVMDQLGNLWLGYPDNLYRISLNDQDQIEAIESIHQHKLFQEKGMEKVRALYPDPFSNSIWIGSDTQGLYQVKLKKGEKLKNAKVSHFTHDPANPRSLSSNFVTSIVRSKDNTLWIGTEQGGLLSMHNENKHPHFTTFSEKDGLSNNVVKNLHDDGKGNLWIATNIGLTRMQISERKFHVYTTREGLPFNEFWYGSSQNKTGSLVYCNGTQLSSFKPHELPQFEPLPRVHFDSFSIYGQKVQPNTSFNGRVILAHRPSPGDEIEIRHDENVFALGLDVLYPRQGTNHHILYQLEPSNSKWISIPASQGKIEFNGLQPGRYKLKVRASNSFGQRTETQVLYIRVLTPWWKNGWAVAFYFLGVLLLFVTSIWIAVSVQELRHKLVYEEQEIVRLQSLNEERQRYFANISHELKTPLTLIIAPLTLLTERFKLDLEIKEKLHIIQRQAKKMLQLIDLAHGIQLDDEQLLQPKPTCFNFDVFINELVADFKFMANYDQKNFQILHPETRLVVQGDQAMLEKVMNNLLNNAFKHTKAGDEIKLSYVRNKEILTIEVSDTGYGIGEADLPYIFERYYMAKSQEGIKVGGTGIGLTFSKRLVELHAGTISVSSNLNYGSTFTINLPILIDELASNPNLTEEHQPSEADLIMGNIDINTMTIAEQYKNATVFLVEDNSEMRSFLSEIIGNFFRVRAYTTGKECLEAMEEEWPDIIVSDVMMPEMQGDELCSIIKNDLKTSHIPVILLTACNTVDDKIKGIQVGADAYIGKPFYPKYVITCIETLLKNREQLKERFNIGIPLTLKKSDQFSAKDTAFLEKLYALFSENLDNENIDIDAFAVKMGMNRSMFFSKVKVLTDYSPYELLKNHRLQQAAELLQGGEYNVNEVCSMVGFKSRTHFSRLFKEKYEVSPSKFGETMKNKLT